MSNGIALFALVVGFMAGSGGAVGALSVWSGQRAGAVGLVSFGLVSALGSMAVLALLLWLTPLVSSGMAFLGVVLGVWLVWLLVRGRLSRGTG
jgi:hypothetical protein